MTMDMIEQPQGTAIEKGNAQTAIASTRAAQEVQAAIVMATQFPRNEMGARQRILTACDRFGLAKDSQYVFARGGTEITGPSIRLAEELARCWGNLQFGTVELEQTATKTHMMAFCWDLETNTREQKTWTVPHLRVTKNARTVLTDPRDIYENNANQGSRRLRACILALIPSDIQDDALERCNLTLKKAAGQQPLETRITAMVDYFKSTHGVEALHIEALIQHKIAAITERDLLRLRKIASAIEDGFTDVGHEFAIAEGKTAVAGLADRLNQSEGAKDASVDVPRGTSTEHPSNPPKAAEANQGQKKAAKKKSKKTVDKEELATDEDQFKDAAADLISALVGHQGCTSEQAQTRLVSMAETLYATPLGALDSEQQQDIMGLILKGDVKVA